MCTWAHFQGVKLPLHEVDHSPASGTDVNNTWIYVSIPPHVFMTRCSIKHRDNFILSLPNWYSGWWSPIGSTRHCGHQWPIVSAPGDYDDGEIAGMIGRGNRSTRRKAAPVPLCPPQTPHAAPTRTRAAAVGSQRLTAWATARLCSTWISPSKPGRRTAFLWRCYVGTKITSRIKVAEEPGERSICVIKDIAMLVIELIPTYIVPMRWII
jgi:hypothetical protein